jgi:hypothetical protein
MGHGIGTFPTLSLDLAANRIATPFPELTLRGNTYFSLIPLDSDKPKFFRDFHDWLVEVCASEGS